MRPTRRRARTRKGAVVGGDDERIDVSHTPEPPYPAVIFYRLVQHRGRATWYSNYRVRIATVEREYGFPE
jgi:hypothetical protein